MTVNDPLHDGFLNLEGESASALQPSEERAPSSPTLAGRKRLQPTGGLGWPGEDAGEGIGGSSHDGGLRGNEEKQTTNFAVANAGGEGPAAAAAAVDFGQPFGGDHGGTCGVDGDGDEVGGDGDGTDSCGEIEHDVGDTPEQSISLKAATACGAPTTELAAAATAAAEAAEATSAVIAAASAAPAQEEGAARICLLGDFDFTFEELNKMAKRYATVNTLGSRTPMPLLGWLTRELDMNHQDMRSLILRHPRLMAYRVTSHVAPKTKWLRERLGLGQAALRKLVTTYPAVLSRSVEKNLEPKFRWLEERLGASQDEVSMLITRFPLIFGYSTTQNLEPTVAFFTGILCGEQEEIKAAIMSCPSILSRSLDKRMMPRTQQMRDKDIEPRFGPHKWVVSTYTDAQFARWLEGRGT